MPGIQKKNLLFVFFSCLLLSFHPADAQTNTITSAEYYLDTDPGFGKGTSILFPAAANIVDLNLNADIHNLAAGIHYLHIRAKDANGNWSLNNETLFYKGSLSQGGSLPAIPNTVLAEYYLDTDPGFGNGIAIPFSPGTRITSIALNAAIGGLANGIHYLHIRAKDANGNWSLNNETIFYKGDLSQGGSLPAVPNTVLAEYYLDTDPGRGNGIAIPFSPGTRITSIALNAAIGSLANGIHYLHIRVKDANGNWSLNNETIFYKGDLSQGGSLPAAGNLQKLEYFIDTDPGVGKGNAVTVPANTTSLVNFAFSVELSGNLPPGEHKLFTRALDDWSLTTVTRFTTTTPLPIALLNFTGRLEGEQVVLSWQTASELNNDHFVIERSLDGLRFNPIGTVKGIGTSSVQQDYTFTDTHPVPKLNYYRLTQVDRDGKSTYSGIIIVNYNTAREGLIISPNPTHGIMGLQIYTQKDQKMQFQLYNTNGQLLQVKEFPCARGGNDFQWDITSLSKGIYLIRSGNSASDAIRIIKE